MSSNTVAYLKKPKDNTAIGDRINLEISPRNKTDGANRKKEQLFTIADTGFPWRRD